MCVVFVLRVARRAREAFGRHFSDGALSWGMRSLGLNFYGAPFPRPRGPELEAACSPGLEEIQLRLPPLLPEQPVRGTPTLRRASRTAWQGHGETAPGNETISSLRSSCRNKPGPPWHLSPPVPPAGLLATRGPPRNRAPPPAAPLPAHARSQPGRSQRLAGRRDRRRRAPLN